MRLLHSAHLCDILSLLRSGGFHSFHKTGSAQDGD
jgi:hypothetical protein